MRGKPPRYARRETDASNSDDRSARDSEERRNKVEKVESQRCRRVAAPFILGAFILCTYTVSLSFIAWVYRMEFLSVYHAPSAFHGLVRQGLRGGMQ